MAKIAFNTGNRYRGWYSWEDEPENRSPMDIARRMRDWISRELG
jgi:hypothetical protein